MTMMDFSGPPPPYSEVDSHPSSPKSSLSLFRVARKPVNIERPKTAPSRNDDGPPIFFEEFEKLKKTRLPTPLPSSLTLSPRRDRLPLLQNSSIPSPTLSPRRDAFPRTSPNGDLPQPQLHRSPSSSTHATSSAPPAAGGLCAPPPLRHASSNVSLNSSVKSSQSASASYVQQAFKEARHFAGGLITHPVESTKNFSILRHSHGLVFYQGAETTLAISIFAEQPLPPERTLWLQSKGWSGKTGMRARAFMGRNGNWINVTPALNVASEQLKASDERAWQRDIAHFRKKPKNSRQRFHVLRETAIVRIPEEAEDGYFQFVLCLGDREKVLCPSPVFRILSSSTSPGSIRGASLTTLPLELGVMAFETYARNTAGRAVGPVAAVVQKRVQKFLPSWITQPAASAALGVMKPSDGTATPDAAQVIEPGGLAWAVSNGDPVIDEGPQAPYPLRFLANSEPARVGTEHFNMPGMALSGVPTNITQLLSGYYLGWARYTSQLLKSSKTEEDTWFPAVISALSIPGNTKNIIVRLTRDYDDIPPEQRVIEMRIMGLLRADDAAQRAALQRDLQARDDEAAELVMLAEMNDILLTEHILDRPVWHPDTVPRAAGRSGTGSSGQSIRTAAQRQMGKVPFHKFGLRASPLDGAEPRHAPLAANGYYVRR